MAGRHHCRLARRQANLAGYISDRRSLRGHDVSDIQLFGAVFTRYLIFDCIDAMLSRSFSCLASKGSLAFSARKSLSYRPGTRPAEYIGIIRAWTPFLLLIVFIANWAFSGTQSLLERYTVKIPFGALHHGISVAGKALDINYSFAWLSAAGTAIFLAALLSAVLMRMPPKHVLRIAGQTLHELRKPLITIASIVGFAYVANYSGMSATLSKALSNTGKVFPLVAPLLGWLGVFITGSDTSSNALFSSVQAHTASALGINPVLTVASNSTGGVAAKMISPQNVAVAAAATKLNGKEGRLFRRVILHSLAMVGIICILTYLQAYYFKWMIPAYAPLRAVSKARFDISDLTIIAVSILAITALAVIARRGHTFSRTKNSVSPIS